ncbi:hypothetical protein AYX15_02400 [Cryptococcus neoformans]|nr:hypothetical protein AYX15_02400 [Cryptococcus neoformans var. grubii]
MSFADLITVVARVADVLEDIQDHLCQEVPLHTRQT